MGIREDVRYGARMLVKGPGFTLVAVITLALGIGATTAIFSVVNAVLLRPLPFPEPERLATVWNIDRQEGGGEMAMTWPDFADMRAQNQSFAALAAFDERDLTLTGVGEAARLRGAVVSSDLFPLLGVAPQVGRFFTADEEQPGARAVILSHGLWRNRFGADAQVVGRAVAINEQSYSVVGVMPASFAFPIGAEPAEMWISVAAEAEGRTPRTQQRGNHFLEVIGRLKPGVTLGQAQAEVGQIAAALGKQYPETNGEFGARAVPYFDRVVGDTRPALLLLLGAVGFVLLISCANVANLLLARAAGRQREVAIRAALGADRARVVRQLLTESLLLGLVGGAAGLLLAVWGSEALLALVPGRLPRAAEAALDGRVLGFTLAASLLTGILFGLAPALQASKPDLTAALKEGGRSVGAGRRASRTRGALIVAQVATAFVLLVGAGLLVNSLLRLQRIEPGFDPERMLSFRVSLPPAKYSEPQQIESFYQGLLTRVGALPGVTAVSATSALPLSGQNSVVGFAVEGVPTPPQTPFPHTSGLRVVRPGYFGTMGIRLLQGRDFDARDTLRSTPVTIINEALARRHFRNQNPIGRRINPSFGVDDRGILFREIIGVVGDVRHSSLREEAGPESYVAHAQAPFNTITVVARAGNDPRALTAAVRGEVRTLDPDLPVFAVRTLEEYLATAVAQPRFGALLLSIFAGVALLLTAVGLYGVISYGVEQRRHEIGVRMALGARARDVLGLVMRQGVALAAAGIGLGLVAAAALTRVMASFLFGVGATDPATFALIALLLGLVALAASYVPALRAARVDPLDALRDQ